MPPGCRRHRLARAQTVLDDPKLLLDRPPPAARQSADDLNTLVLVRHKPVLEDIPKPPYQAGCPIKTGASSDEQKRDLYLDPTFMTIQSRAGERGQSKNPLFTHVDAVVSGIVIYCHTKVPNTLLASSGSKYGVAGVVDGAQALMLGAQAIGMATIGTPTWGEAKKDYDNRTGIAYGRMFGLLKPQYESRWNGYAREDFGVFSLYTAAAEVAASV